MTEKPRVYYKADTMLRYNPLWCMVLGERSVGKTYEFKRRSITTPDTLWVYLRRTDKLAKDPKNWKSYLSDLLMNEHIDIDAEYKVNSEGIWVDGIQKVIFSALSTDSGAHSMTYLPDVVTAKDKSEGKQHTRRSKKADEDEDYNVNHLEREGRRIEKAYETSADASDSKHVLKKKIVYEEIIEPSGRYIKNEVEQLFEFYVTVDRYTDTQLFGVANLMTTYNPYFEYFGIRPFTEEFRWYRNKTLLVQNVKIPGMDDYVKRQRFYNLVEGTDYGDYLMNNSPWQDDDYGLSARPHDSKLVCNIRLHELLYGVWEKEGMLYVDSRNNPNFRTFSGLRSMRTGDIPITKGEGVHKLLNNASDFGLLRFENMTIRELIYEVIAGGYRLA